MYINKSHGAAVRQYSSTETNLHKLIDIHKQTKISSKIVGQKSCKFQRRCSRIIAFFNGLLFKKDLVVYQFLVFVLSCTILATLSHLQCPDSMSIVVVLAVLSWPSSPGTPFLVVLSRLPFHRCPVLAVFSWLPCSDCLFRAVLFWLSFPGYPVLAVFSWLSCSGCLFLAVLFWLAFPGYPVPSVLFWLSCSGLVSELKQELFQAV
jgi:hypothetical protein